MEKIKNKEGFTLTELLVSLVIITWMAALVLPVLSKAREVARRAVCSNNIRQLIIA
ncbi:prepilin-type N-terminal cleavage/methylation domain-containing protein, partial [bacterium]|nr:prepilin-type N-terminal cleavage/methylation domain-containing protein [bacterium]